MINKATIQSIISKYYLGEIESVKWTIKNNIIDIDFMTANKCVAGSLTCNDFQLEDCDLAIYDTKKLTNLINICNGDLLLELEKQNKLYTKLKISDLNFNLTYALSDPLLINKVPTVNIPEWIVELNFTTEDIENLIKAKSALAGVDNMLLTTTTNLDNEPVCEFIFGDEAGHNNKITYQILGNVKEDNLKLPFDSDMFKTILHANKDMEEGSLFLSSMGLMYMKFKTSAISSEYYMVRRAETNF